METILHRFGILFPLILLVFAFLGIVFEVLGLPIWGKRSKQAIPSEPKKGTPILLQTLIAPFLFVLILAVSIWLACHIDPAVRTDAPPSEATAATTAPVDETPEPSAPQDAATEIKMTSSWLDEMSPMIDKQKNFLFGSWGDGSELVLDGRAYTHGVGMRICGTQFEGSVPASDAPYKTDRYDCRQVYTEFALRSEYSMLTFSIGADNGDKTYYGSEENNGVAQVLIYDSDRDEVLFDTGWVNYSYAQYDVSISLANVEQLKIVYRTSGIPHKRPANTLQFVLVNPVLKLVED